MNIVWSFQGFSPLLFDKIISACRVRNSIGTLRLSCDNKMAFIGFLTPNISDSDISRFVYCWWDEVHMWDINAIQFCRLRTVICWVIRHLLIPIFIYTTKQIYDKWFIEKRFKHKGDNSYTAIKWIELKKFKVVRYWVSERLLVYAKWAFYFRDQFRQTYSYKWSWDYLRNGILKWPTVPPMSKMYWSIVYGNIQ